jgi:short-subunit dehydrogenase
VKTALVVGASAGIGDAIARRLVEAGWTVIGTARRESAIAHASYRHVIADVRAAEFRDVLAKTIDGAEIDLCIYAAGIGEPLDVAKPVHEVDVIATNLVGLAATVEVVLPRMAARKSGHIIGLSSQADRLIDEFAPSYAASKAGMSSYLEGLALACRKHGVAVTNLRLGFVDTAMSRYAETRPFMMTADRAAQVIERCIKRRPIRKTAPLRMAFLLWFFGLPRRIRVWFS